MPGIRRGAYAAETTAATEGRGAQNALAGSGCQTALLAKIVHQVCSIQLVAELAA